VGNIKTEFLQQFSHQSSSFFPSYSSSALEADFNAAAHLKYKNLTYNEKFAGQFEKVKDIINVDRTHRSW